MYRRKPVVPDPDRYIPTPAERLAQELAGIDGTAKVLEGTLRRVRIAAFKYGPDHNVGGYMMKAVEFIRDIDADGAYAVAHHLFIFVDDFQMDRPWAAKVAIPFLEQLIQNSRDSRFDAIMRNS
jgi:hypothetical protein